jgi:alginate biosynthesis protein Alg44
MKETKKTDKSPQIVHEAEITRQHARYKLPATLEIDGKKFELEDWSISGCAIKNLPDNIFDKKFTTGKIIFKFDDFETVVDKLKLEFVIRKPDGSVGCRFTELTPQQLSILNQIIASFLAGDIVTQDDIIHAVTRTITYKKKEKPKVNKKKASLILIFIYFVVFILLMFLGYVVYKRVFVVQTANTYVDANLTVIRAPAPTYIYYPKKHFIGEKVKTGDMLLTSYLVAGGVQKIASPINGSIYKISALNGEFRNVAEPVLYLLPDNNASVYITAHVLHKNLIKLKIGDIATVVTPEQEKFYAKIIKIIPAHTVFQEKAKHLLENIYNQPRNYDTIILQTNHPLYNLINKSLFVTIDTFLNRFGFLSLDNNNETEEKNITEENNSYKTQTLEINKSEKNQTEDKNKTIKPETLKADYSNYGNSDGNTKIVKEENKTKTQKSTYENGVETENISPNNNEENKTTSLTKGYCIIAASTPKLITKQTNLFLKRFPDGKIEKYKNIYEFKIEGFKTYKEAKKFANTKVNKYYKNPFIIGCKFETKK